MYRTLTPNGSSNKSDMSMKVNTVCCKLRGCLQDKGLVIYANAIMTSYVCQQPQDLGSALRVITAVKRRSDMKSSPESHLTLLPTALDPKSAEDAIHYIIFLADANRLYDVALGMYDFELVLAIAQNSQKVSLNRRCAYSTSLSKDPGSERIHTILARTSCFGQVLPKISH